MASLKGIPFRALMTFLFCDVAGLHVLEVQPMGGFD
jgi:hypothetical protein